MLPDPAPQGARLATRRELPGGAEVQAADDGVGLEVDATVGVGLVDDPALEEHVMAEQWALRLEIDDVDGLDPQLATDRVREGRRDAAVECPAAIERR